ncbi:MAG: DUF1499 domain-containing protein [Pseudomonadota bacterium]
MNQAAATPGLVTWSVRLAVLSLVLLPISVLLVRSGAWQAGLPLIGIACLGAVVLMVLMLILVALPRFAPFRSKLLRGMLCAIPGVLVVGSLAGGGNAPPIHDITTDTVDPPSFVTAAEARGPGTNSLDIKPDFIEQQKAAYPDLASIQSPLPAAAALSRAVATATDLGWEVYHQDNAAGIVEAVDTTQIMGFKDDVVIRVRADGTGSTVDLRSVSRVGLSDIGANAARIRDFVAAFTAANG